MTVAAAPAPVQGPRTRARRTVGTGRPTWSALTLLVALLVASPVLAVVVDGLVNGRDAALPRGLGGMVVTTLLLMTGVGVGTLVVGGGLAWLVTAYRFPGRDVLVWLLVLPLAMPAYILGFVFISTFDAAGPAQSALREVVGDGLAFSVRTLPGAVVVMSLSLFPYVYLLARAALVEQSPSTYDAARSLGASRRRTFWRVVVPLARPSLAAGLALVMMEVLTDFATVQYFGVKTVSVGVYLVWKGSYDFHAATQISVLVLGFAVAVLAGERLMRGRARFTQRGGRGDGLRAHRLVGWRAWAATLACLTALAAGFFVPVARLVGWAVAEARTDPAAFVDERFGQYLANSLAVAAIAAAGCVLLSLVMSHAVRVGGGRLVRSAASVTTFGYAVPGAVVGIGVLLAFAWADRALEAVGVPNGTGLLVTGSVLGILYAYLVRFLAPAYQAVDASFAKVAPSMTLSAMSLGAGPLRVLRRVHLPLVRPGVAVALVLVTVDAIKELPIVLLLRPFGFTTVSVWVYQLAAENFWRQAALPALVIVLTAVLPVYVLFRQIRAGDRGVARER